MNRAGGRIVLALVISGICAAQGPTRTSPVAARQSSQSQYLKYLQNSLTKQTEWAVFENNNPKLWSKVRDTVSNFLTNEWQQGKLQGSRSQDAFYVRCDATTMTQNDLDNGRLILVVGVATLRPGEFTIIRITQHTGRHK